MTELPNIEQMKNTLDELLNQFKSFHQFYNTTNSITSPECTKNLRKIYNQISTEINKLRLYNNAIETNNREERRIKKGIPDKEKKKLEEKKNK